MALSAGTKLGAYELLGPIGAGGMGEVYRAHDTRLDRDVALKVLPASALGDEAARARLQREARLAAALNHPHVCTIYDAGETDGHVYIAMELVSGHPLSDVVPSNGLSLESVVRYGVQIADALAHAHARGVVHRDLKCANVIITTEGRAKILDFGLATRRQQDIDDVTRSRATLGPGVVAGTLAYMAPEVLRGATADARSDIWALGVVLYEMASGKVPFRGHTGVELTSAILRDAPAPLPPGVAAGLVGIIQKCLSKDASQRYGSAAEVRAALETIGTSAHLTIDGQRATRRSRAVVVGAAVVALAVVLTALGMWASRDQAGSFATRVQSLAVLPLENLSGDPSQEYFADGMTEELITRLSKISELRVISRATVMRFKGGQKPPLPEIAKQLSVQGIVTGSVAYSTDRVRVTVQLVDARDRNLWAERYDRPMSDLLAIQAEVASAIAGGLRANLSPKEKKRLVAARAVAPEAYDAYLRGKFHARFQTEKDNAQEIDFFGRAVAVDPQFAAARAELGRAYAHRLYFWAPSETQLEERATVEIERALAIDPDLDVAHLAKGKLLWQPWNHFPHERTIAEYRRVIELNPSEDEAHFELGTVYLHVGLLEEALREIQEAIRLNPDNVLARFREGVAYLYQGRYTDALGVFSKTPNVSPFARALQLSDTLFHLGRREDAAATVAEYLAKNPDDPGGSSTSVQAMLEADAGRVARVEALVASAQEKGKGFGHFHHTAYTIARAYALLGRTSDAVMWLQRAADDGFPCYTLFANDPLLNKIRDDHTFQEFLAQQKQRWEGFKKLVRSVTPS